MRSLQAGQSFIYQDLEFFGLSLSGIHTSLTMPKLSLAFDVAQGLPFNLHMKKYFITQTEVSGMYYPENGGSRFEIDEI